MPFASIPEILEELKAGKMVVLVDDEDSVFHKRNYFKLDQETQTASAVK